MGSDGHTASLFPFAEGLDEAMDQNKQQLCGAINASPSEVTGELTERMSLTYYGIKKSNEVILLITGEDKKQVFEDAKSLAESGQDYRSMPISRFLSAQSQINLSVYWAP